ncbi:pyridoxamine 5'-phosphate oxidase family protein [Haloferacaceae archaeon DSL9]
MAVPSDVESLIRDAPVSAHLATSIDDRPHVAAVWYVYDGGSLYVLTGGKKLRNLRENPRVAVSIERADGPAVEWSVTALGTARVLDDPLRRREIERRMSEKYGAGTDTDGGDEVGSLAEIRLASATGSEY